MNRRFGSILALAATALSGCAATLSGLDATESYGCKAPEGVTCMSVSGIYANSTHGSLRPRSAAPKSSADASGIYGASSVALGQPPAPGTVSHAVRSNSRLLRVWIAPWEDSDGDLHEAGYVHMVVDTGRWLIEHVRPARRGNVDGVTPAVAPAAEPAAPKDPSPAIDATPLER